MGKGKYSPSVFGSKFDGPYDRNAKGEHPAPYDHDNYNTETMFAGYGSDGYDRYGYSAYDANGKYVGLGGSGVDRNGLTEWDYAMMTDDEFDTYWR